MVTIIKGNKTIMIGPGEISNIDSTYDGVLIRCADQTEIKFNFIAPKGLNALMNVANRCVDKDIKIDLNAAMKDDLSHVLTIGSANQLKEPPKVKVEDITKKPEQVQKVPESNVTLPQLPATPVEMTRPDTAQVVGVIG